MTQASIAREAAGYAGKEGLERLARAVRLSPRYIRRLELHGCDCAVTAFWLSRFLGCGVEVYLSRGTAQTTVAGRANGRRRTNTQGKAA